MFDVGASELLVIIVVAIVVVGPKDLPRAMRTAGQWVGKIRRISGHFRAGIDAMIREAELEEMEKIWQERNAAIMKDFPDIATGRVANAPAALPATENALPPDNPREGTPDSEAAPEHPGNVVSEPPGDINRP